MDQHSIILILALIIAILAILLAVKKSTNENFRRACILGTKETDCKKYNGSSWNTSKNCCDISFD